MRMVCIYLLICLSYGRSVTVWNDFIFRVFLAAAGRLRFYYCMFQEL